MPLVSISRKQICDAIAKEPTTTLGPGRWVDTARAGRSSPTLKSRVCTVCAVGSVMRNALLHHNQPAYAINLASSAAMEYENCDDGVTFTYGNPEELAADECYMAALSAFFEQAAYDGDIRNLSGRERMKAVQKIKKDCIAFVKKNFPARIKVDIDGAIPAQGIKVLKVENY